jgi:hypothetical protein
VRLFGKLHVISAPYLVWAAYAFFTLFSMIPIFWMYDFLIARFNQLAPDHSMNTSVPVTTADERRLWRRHISAGIPVLLTLFIPACTYYLWTNEIRPFQVAKQPLAPNGIFGASPIREPVIGPITQYLIDHASLAPGKPFRGYTVSYFGDPGGHLHIHLKHPGSRMGWQVHVASREYLELNYGNRFQEMDLWQFDIPTVEEYGQWITKQAHTFVTRLLSSPAYESFGAMLQVYRLDRDLLAAMGVRFIITDLDLSDPRLTQRAIQESTTAGPIRLYELSKPNVASYSPDQLETVETFDAALDFVLQNKGRLDRRAIVFAPLHGKFGPARESTLHVEKDGFRIRAASDGRSALLVPVQFSNCLKIIIEQSRGNISSARLTRANGIQTLLVFEGNVDLRVRFEFGLAGTTQCRRQDVRDLKSVGMR